MISTDLFSQMSNVLMHEDMDEDGTAEEALWAYVAGLGPDDAGRLSEALRQLADLAAGQRSEFLDELGFGWSIEEDEPGFFAALAEAVDAIQEVLLLE